jgi:hypothetical protein
MNFGWKLDRTGLVLEILTRQHIEEAGRGHPAVPFPLAAKCGTHLVARRGLWLHAEQVPRGARFLLQLANQSTSIFRRGQQLGEHQIEIPDT